jgi:hypothetical protein
MRGMPHVVRPLARLPVSIEEARHLLQLEPPLRLARQWPAAPSRPPAEVRLGHAAGSLAVLAELPDAFIVQRASGPNQRFWELGDTFEMFLQGRNREEYLELHVNPNGHALQLRIPSSSAFAGLRIRGAFEELLLPEGSFQAQAEVVFGGWRAFASVPSELVAGVTAPLAGSEWRFSFCRYDYDDPDGEPVLSSTSAFRELDFHRVEEWSELCFA